LQARLETSHFLTCEHQEQNSRDNDYRVNCEKEDKEIEYGCGSSSCVAQESPHTAPKFEPKLVITAPLLSEIGRKSRLSRLTEVQRRLKLVACRTDPTIAKNLNDTQGDLRSFDIALSQPGTLSNIAVANSSSLKPVKSILADTRRRSVAKMLQDIAMQLYS
jgi:hypothetical protein